MKKMEFTRYTSMETVACCGDLYKEHKITNFTVKCEYTRVMIRIKTHFGTIELVFYSSGKVTIKGYAFFDDFKFETVYYKWAEDTSTEEIAKQLKTDLQSAVSADDFYDTANCFASDNIAERTDV